MHCSAEQDPPPFRPVTVSFTLETERELNMLYLFLGLDETVPEAVQQYMNGSDFRGCTPKDIKEFLFHWMQRQFSAILPFAYAPPQEEE